MRIESQFNQLVNNPTLTSTIGNALQKLALALMCVRVGIVQEFFPDSLTADVLIVNKITTGLNQDGSQIVKDWGKIRAKVCYCSPFDTFPIKKGDECVLLFSDRELESWFINGTSSPIAHSRMHDETDCIAIFGIRSLPNMISVLLDARHIFYGNSELILKETQTDINSNTININASNINLTGTLTINGQPYLSHTHSNGNEGSPTGGVIT